MADNGSIGIPIVASECLHHAVDYGLVENRSGEASREETPERAVLSQVVVANGHGAIGKRLRSTHALPSRPGIVCICSALVLNARSLVVSATCGQQDEQ
jgi:hypothetical protein